MLNNIEARLFSTCYFLSSAIMARAAMSQTMGSSWSWTSSAFSVDDYAKRLQAENPGLRATRADALRVLLSKALAAEGKTQTSKR
jgi:hypothetical protein